MFNVGPIDLIVVRVTRCPDRPIAMAKPCRQCLPILQMIGVRHIYYTGPDGVLVREYAAEMTTDHIPASLRFGERRQN